MKREQFLITSTVGHNVIKSKWNSSIRAIEAMAKELAQSNETTYTLIDSKSVKGDFGYVEGSRTWENAKNGSQVIFTVCKLDENN